MAFGSEASTLVAGDTNGSGDVFMRDRRSGHTERVSVSADGAQANGSSGGPAISADGRFVAYSSQASNLVAGDTNGHYDVFVHDRQNGTTERVSVASDGAEATLGGAEPSISAAGRFVAFSSEASNLVAGDTNGNPDIFVHDRQSGTTERVSVGNGGRQVGWGAVGPVISADGRFVAFNSLSAGLAAGDTNGRYDVFVHDRQRGTTERVSVSSDGTQTIDGAYSPAISADGRFVAFISSGLVAGDTNNSWDVYVRDRQSATTERVSIASDGSEANSHSHAPALSESGRFVAFASEASNLVAGDTDGSWRNYKDVFVRDRQSGTTERASVGADAVQAHGESMWPAINADGRVVVFASSAATLVTGDTNGFVDVFVRDRDGEGCTILGGPGDDVLTGTPGDDVICGLGGDDDLSGGDGHDVLSGGDGDDRLLGGVARDVLDGGFGNDQLAGGSGADSYGGGPGVDLAAYWGQTKPVTATIGDDGANDGVAKERDDIKADIEQLTGGKGDDILTGNQHNNRLSGGKGNDRLIGGRGADQLVGGDGDDSHDANDGERDSVTCGNGLDSVLHDTLDWLSPTCEDR